ncbi:MAG TPA: flagellar biosynthetic protein FliO [Telluria sp.]
MAGALLLASAAVVHAAPVVTAQPVVANTMSPAAGSLLQTILALTFVLALLGALAWLMKRFGPRSHVGTVPVRLVGALSLGGRERIMVVEVGNQWIVVGASPGRVNALATMPAQGAGGDNTAGAGHATLAEHQSPAASFGDWLKQTIDKRNAK